jgi:predicted RecA/RadA family phage recombinase
MTLNNFLKPGVTITLTAPGGGVVSGTVYLIGVQLVVATNTVAAGLPFEGLVEGVITHAKAASQAWTEGQVVFWDDVAKVFTTVRAANTRAGIAAAAVPGGAGDTTGTIRLNGIGGPKFFLSAEQTGTGASQNIAHGLGVVPELIVVYPTDTAPATTGAYTMTEGAHTSTNVVVTVTSGKKFKVFAFA